MPFTRTVNYIQSTPISINWASYLVTTPSRNVTVIFDIPANQGFLTVPEVAGVFVQTQLRTAATGTVFQTKVYGPVASVNTALNATLYNPMIGYLAQADATTETRTDTGGTELMVQIGAAVVHGLTVGASCKISGYTFTVGKIDSTNSPTRFWLMGPDLYPALGTILQTSGGATIAPIIDVAKNNPVGTYTNNCTVIDGATEVNTYTFAGTFFIAEPTFSSPPATTMTLTLNTWTDNLNFGQIAQTNSNYESVQICAKAFENDPWYLGYASYTSLPGYPSAGTDEAKLLFIGNAIAAKSDLNLGGYTTGEQYGSFASIRLGNRASSIGGITQWNLTDIPDNCNYALSNMSFYRTANVDFKFETRIVDGQARIYADRGK